MVRRSKPAAVARPLDPNDPRNPDHPGQEERWLELARQLGRAQADLEYEQKLRGTDHEARKHRRVLRPVLNRQTKSSLNR